MRRESMWNHPTFLSLDDEVAGKPWQKSRHSPGSITARAGNGKNTPQAGSEATLQQPTFIDDR
jgi:hypothetical protein